MKAAAKLPETALCKASKEKLVREVLSLRSEVARLESANAELQAELDEKNKELAKLKKKEINQTTNQPSSKQPEFNKDTGAKKKRRKRGRKARPGAGNRPKPEPEFTETTPLICCPCCQGDLSEQPIIETTSRIVEDIPDVPKETVVSAQLQERKWCPNCGKVVSSSSEAALPRSDIGLRALVLMAYLWVVPAVSLPGIAALLGNFFRMTLSTAGISRMMIRLGKIFLPVHEEILDDVKGGAVIFADETGWRIKGVLWWLWIFANDQAAFYWPDKLRGSPVVEKILGTVFSGVLVTDAWCAYRKIVCLKQTCTPHLLRKIKKFRDAFPQYYSIFRFYRGFRRILADGERLKLNRKDIGEDRFQSRLNRLKTRLHDLLAWKNPNPVLKEVIAKVARQEDYILTYVEHDGVPKHNNFGEYIIKKGILKRKVSGGSMSEDGAMAYAVLQSIAQTCHLRGLSFTDYLRAALLHYIRTGAPLALAQYQLSFQEEKLAA